MGRMHHAFLADEEDNVPPEFEPINLPEGPWESDWIDIGGEG